VKLRVVALADAHERAERVATLGQRCDVMRVLRDPAASDAVLDVGAERLVE
jgi:hypothetical protein